MLSSALRSIERGRMQGANETLVAAAAGGGSFSTGLIYASGGLVTLSAVSMVLTGILLVVTIWYMLYLRGQVAPADVSSTG